MSDTIVIRFAKNARPSAVTEYSLHVLRDILSKAGLNRALVSSTARNPQEQARVMYENIVARGVSHQKKLYAAAGDEVIDVFIASKTAGRSQSEIQADMTEKIIALGPSRVSRHACDPKVLNVFDAAPSSIANKHAFEAAVVADERVSKFLTPPDDPGYHLEIPQNAHNNHTAEVSGQPSHRRPS